MPSEPASSSSDKTAPSHGTPPIPSEGQRPPLQPGVVVIGRNEGERLRRCLASLAGQVSSLIYVDSGSQDGSVALAARMGAVVVDLDTSIPFTAARARNTGLAKLRELEPGLELVQFVDGDCELMPDWMSKATSQIRSDPTVAVVCGRLRERHPEASIYNRLCDIEWNAPVGYTEASGGIALMRIRALSEVDGFNPNLIAGEEPDLCLRLRQHGYRIYRMATDMAWHDADMKRFSQWWKRTVRSGHAYAEGYTLHRFEPGKYCVRHVRSGLVWGLVVPVLTLGLLVPSGGWSSVLLGGYFVLAVRVFRSSRRRGLSPSDARLHALSCVVGRFPMALGILRYWVGRAMGRRSELIEYRRVN